MADLIHHLASLEDWEHRSHGRYEPAGLATDGFIHLCTPEQLGGVVERYYRGRNDLLLLTIQPDQLDAPLIWEDSTGAGEDFPHLYGSMNLDAISAAEPFEAVP